MLAVSILGTGFAAPAAAAAGCAIRWGGLLNSPSRLDSLLAASQKREKRLSTLVPNSSATRPLWWFDSILRGGCFINRLDCFHTLSFAFTIYVFNGFTCHDCFSKRAFGRSGLFIQAGAVCGGTDRASSTRRITYDLDLLGWISLADIPPFFCPLMVSTIFGWLKNARRRVKGRGFVWFVLSDARDGGSGGGVGGVQRGESEEQGGKLRRFKIVKLENGKIRKRTLYLHTICIMWHGIISIAFSSFFSFLSFFVLHSSDSLLFLP